MEITKSDYTYDRKLKGFCCKYCGQIHFEDKDLKEFLGDKEKLELEAVCPNCGNHLEITVINNNNN